MKDKKISYTGWEIFVGVASFFVGFILTKFIVGILFIVIDMIFGIFNADVTTILGSILGLFGGIWTTERHYKNCKRKHLEAQKIAVEKSKSSVQVN